MTKTQRPTRWTFRAIQLDLARQYETPDAIIRFIDLAANWGYNTLAMYLEGMIRTRSFPYPDPHISYTPEEMRRLVAYAAERGMDVIPVVSNLGHTEQFLRHAGLEDMAELRGGRVGRFKHALHVACPSLDKTRDFFQHYFEEIAEIFPSPYFHAGNDEAWDMGFCKLCAPRARRGGIAGIFRKHILETHDFITRQLGRTMIMWDDMWEFCPEVLDDVPRDVVQCTWLYEEVFQTPHSRFCNRTTEDLLALYTRLGFSTIIAPRETNLANVRSCTDYALQHPVLGGWLTSWEHSMDFMNAFYPVVAYAGALWNGGLTRDPESLAETVLATFFGRRDPAFIMAAKEIYTRRSWPFATDMAGFLRGAPSLLDSERARSHALVSEVIRAAAPKIKRPLALQTLDDLQVHLEGETLQHRIRPLVMQAIDSPAAGPIKALEHAAADARRLAARRKQQWQRLRGGVEPELASTPFAALADSLDAFTRERQSASGQKQALLNLHGLLPDVYGVPSVKITVRFSGRSQWTQVLSRTIKPHFEDDTYYQINVPFTPPRGRPAALRIEVTGYGGHGFRFVDLVCGGRRYVPALIRKTTGRAENAEHILCNDRRWCYLGEYDVFRTYHTPGANKKKHSVELSLCVEDMTPASVLPGMKEAPI